MLASLLVTSALAIPVFSAAEPEHAQIARAAWVGGIACAGWEPAAHPVVTIHQGYVAGGYTGGAWIDDEGLYRIEVSLHEVERAIVHEIAHAWARGGPPALTEGRTDLLADCIVTRVPGLAPYDPDPGTSLTHMPDLRRWGNPHHDHGLVDIDAARRDAYLGSARLVRVIAAVLEPRVLWPESGVMRWRDLERLLDEHGPEGFMVLAVLEGGAERQRVALSDADRDGVAWLAEVLQGTDPGRWDSDGDGWWDGAPEPPSLSAVPLPPDGTPVCSGLAAGPHGGAVQVIAAGDLRGQPLPWVTVRAGERSLTGHPRAGVDVPANAPVLLALDGPVARSTGGTWVMAGGHGLVDDWSCRSTPRYTVWVEDPLAAPILARFADALDEQVRRADAILDGPSDRRVVVVLGAGEAGIRDGVVRLTTGQVQWAIDNHRPDALAGLAVAVHRVWAAGEDARSWDAAEGLARALVDDPPDLMFVAVDLRDAEAWTEQATACKGGWQALLAGTCRD